MNNDLQKYKILCTVIKYNIISLLNGILQVPVASKRIIIKKKNKSLRNKSDENS